YRWISGRTNSGLVFYKIDFTIERTARFRAITISIILFSGHLKGKPDTRFRKVNLEIIENSIL
ncbi:MAG TPA: hypothetical protein VHO90_12000, partial [Bacteroidales bacterium]|nr:hypothetical protein [Bacteroidales bacterium]